MLQTKAEEQVLQHVKKVNKFKLQVDQSVPKIQDLEKKNFKQAKEIETLKNMNLNFSK